MEFRFIYLQSRVIRLTCASRGNCFELICAAVPSWATSAYFQREIKEGEKKKLATSIERIQQPELAHVD
jgi:hypothetical protein